MKTCFVIQPFDRAKYDLRFQDVFEPAIIAAGYEAYRVDRDPSVKIPIETIEERIKTADICFAEITTDRPNIWYELGFAFAHNREVVMVCESSERIHFPFDIQHRHIIRYACESSSDFDMLRREVTTRLSALGKLQRSILELKQVPIKTVGELQSHEVSLLLLIAGKQITDEESVSVNELKNDMTGAGFTDVATSIALRSLKKRSFIGTSEDSDFYGNSFIACRLTTEGEDWLLSHQHLTQLMKDVENISDLADEIPF